MGFFKKKLETRKQFIWTFTKHWVSRLVTLACIWVTLPYLLGALSGKLNIEPDVIKYLVSLSNNVCKLIIGVMVAYMIKSFSETFAEEKNKLIVKEMEQETENTDESVG